MRPFLKTRSGIASPAMTMVAITIIVMAGLLFLSAVSAAEPKAPGGAGKAGGESAWLLAPSSPPRVEIVRGLWSRAWRLEESLGRIGGAELHDAWHAQYMGFGQPGWWEQGGGNLVEYDGSRLGRLDFHVVVLCNVNAKAVPNADVLVEYVRQGGSLLLLGGRFAFGREYRDSPLAALCPVEFPGQGEGGTDLRQHRDGLTIQPGPAAPPALKGLPWSTAQPRFYWRHDIVARTDAEVWLTDSDGAPLLVCGTFGKGRVAVFAGTVMGEAVSDGQTPFWTWDAWPTAQAAVIEWLLAPRLQADRHLPESLLANIATDAAADLPDFESLDGGLPAFDGASAGAPITLSPADAARLVEAARLCADTDGARRLLTTIAALKVDVPPDVEWWLSRRLGLLVDASFADLATTMVASGRRHTTALGLIALGGSKAPQARETLEAFLLTGEAKVVKTKGNDDVPFGAGMGSALDPKAEEKAALAAFSIRTGALRGLALLHDPAAIPALRDAAKKARPDGHMDPAQFVDVQMPAHRLYQQILLTSVQCGDGDAAPPLVAELMENQYLIARARDEGNKPKDRLGDIEKAIGMAYAWQRTITAQLVGAPPAAQPALARALVAITDRRVANLALACYSADHPPAAEARAILAASSDPVLVALGAASAE